MVKVSDDLLSPLVVLLFVSIGRTSPSSSNDVTTVGTLTPLVVAFDDDGGGDEGDDDDDDCGLLK